MYDLYKPLRNEIRKNALLPSLRAVWSWMQHLQFGDDLADDLEVPPPIRWRPRGADKGIYEWELAILAKELLILAPETSTVDLRSWKHFSAAVNKLRNLDNAISERYEKLFREHIFVEMHRIAHHQFWWQRTLRMDSEVARYLKIFGSPDLDAILRERVGLGAHALYSIGLAVTGHFLTESELVTPLTFNLSAVTAEQIELFFNRYSMPLAEMRELCRDCESFDENFIYAFNPLVQYPIVSYASAGQTRLVAPVPRFLIRRFTEGVYYDVLGSPGFDAAFGDSYQRYVGEALMAVNAEGRLVILPEAEYLMGRDRKRTCDWIASDDSGDLFIECKTKRLRVDAKIALSDLSHREAELSKLAEFAVQIYKTLVHAQEGQYPHWQPRGLPLYPIIVTLEEWHAFGHKLDAEVESRIRSEFRTQGLDERLLEAHPLTICSVGEFERLAALVTMKGTRAVLAEKTNAKRKLWPVHGALLDAFPDDYPKTRTNLFPAALEAITG
jgi:hypothetical protein